MIGGLRLLRWEGRHVVRQLRARPLALVVALVGLPLLLASIAQMGWMLGGHLAERYAAGGLEAALRNVGRVLALIVLLSSGSGVLGSLFNRRVRATIERARSLPVTDGDVYLARRVPEDGQVLFFLLTLMLLAGVRLLVEEVPAVLVLALLASTVALAGQVFVAMRLVVQTMVALTPGRLLNWHTLLWTVVLVAMLAAPSVGAVVASLRDGTEGGTFPPTDWIGSVAESYVAGSTVRMAAWVFGGMAVAALLYLIEFFQFRRLFLRRFDEVVLKLSSAESGRGSRSGFVASALERLPRTVPWHGTAVPLRALILKDGRCVTRSAPIRLAIVTPVACVALGAGALEVMQIIDVPYSITRQMCLATLAVMLCLNGILTPTWLLPFEGRGLGPLGASSWDREQLLYGKAFVACLFTAVAWLLAWVIASLSEILPLALPTYVRVLVVPVTLVFAAWVVGWSGTCLACLFGRPESGDPLRSFSLPGLAVHYLFATLVLVSFAVSVAAPILLGPVFVAVPLFVAGVWALALAYLRAQARASLRGGLV